MPSRNGGAEAARINRTDKNWHRDMPAYKRLRLDGTQPRKIDGCADLEREATDQFEIDMGLIVPKEHKEKIKEGLAISQELELAVSRPKSVQVPGAS